MKTEPIKIRLKDGRTAILRSPEPRDASGMIAYLRTVCTQTDFLLRRPEECSMSEEQERDWIVRNVESENVLMLCCEIDGRIVGNGEIQFNTMLKTRHRASFAIAIMADCWNLGIGTAIFENLIEAAKARRTLILELEYIDGNERARGLYEKMGFRIVGRRPYAIRRLDGSFADEILMQRVLGEVE